jgi:hypothetical protein
MFVKQGISLDLSYSRDAGITIGLVSGHRLGQEPAPALLRADVLDRVLWVQVPELTRYLTHVLVWTADDHLIPCLCKGLGHDSHGVIGLQARQLDQLPEATQRPLGPHIAAGLLPVAMALVGGVNGLPKVLTVREAEEQERLVPEGALKEVVDPVQVPINVLDDIVEPRLDNNHISPKVNLVLCSSTGSIDNEVTVD